jgi:hypothetical protein
MGPRPQTLPLAGGCQCGDVRYELRGAPVGLWICHCLECRKQSSSAFGISVDVRSEDLVLLSGAPKVWTRAATVQGSLDCAFCPRCGSRLWHGSPGDKTVVSVKGGSLDRPPDLSRAIHIWTVRKLDGVVIPDHAVTHEQEPPA